MPDSFADPEVAAFVSAPAPVFADLDVTAIRAGIDQRAQSRRRGPDLHAVNDLSVNGLRARLYRPTAADGPVVLYLHGGGWTVGSVDSSDRVCRRLAARSGVGVLALDYRLAPEHPWPASVDDTVSALSWLRSSPPELRVVDKVAVMGDSAGGTLAALGCLRLRDEQPGLLPDLQVLVYANTDLTGAQPSMRDKAAGYGLDAETVRFFNRQWVPDQARWADPDVSPLQAPDLSGLPAAVIVSAEHDPLRDESEAYAARLGDSGVRVHLRREEGLVHNFLQMDEISPACAAAADRVADDLRSHLTR